jgi:predicted transcriptional regulator
MSAGDPSLFDEVDEAEEERALAEAEAAYAAGRVIGHQAMMDWLASWGGPDEQPPPPVGA